MRLEKIFNSFNALIEVLTQYIGLNLVYFWFTVTNQVFIFINRRRWHRAHDGRTSDGAANDSKHNSRSFATVKFLFCRNGQFQCIRFDFRTSTIFSWFSMFRFFKHFHSFKFPKPHLGFVYQVFQNPNFLEKKLFQKYFFKKKNLETTIIFFLEEVKSSTLITRF